MPAGQCVTSLPAVAAAGDETRWRVEPPADGMIIVRRTGGLPAPDPNPPQPVDWRERLAGYLRNLRGAGVRVVGAKRLADDGSLFSMGEFVVHPKGFHHLGRGIGAEAYRFPEEVDTVAGGLLAVDESAFDAAAAPALLRGQLGAVELGLEVRRGGGRCVVVPDVIVADGFSPRPDAAQSAAFVERWGFDWRCADLDIVRQRHAGTGLLWNVRLHGRAMPFEKYRQRPAFHFKSYEQVQPFRARADHLTRLAAQVTPGGVVLDLGCGDGLFSHLLARRGLEVTGLDPEAAAIEQARKETAGREYPGRPPKFAVGRGEAPAVDDGSVTTVVMFDVIEHLPNPVAVLRSVGRVLAPGGHLVLSTPAWSYGGWSDPVYHVCEYTEGELIEQIGATSGLEVVTTGMIKGLYRDLVVVARKPKP